MRPWKVGVVFLIAAGVLLPPSAATAGDNNQNKVDLRQSSFLLNATSVFWESL
jgi:hypothetical protein